MAQLTVRGLDEDLIQKLKVRAAANGRSAEAEHREILKEALAAAAEDFWERARKLREAIEREHGVLPDSAPLIREMRDERSNWLEERDAPPRPRRR
jgi:plasmid stability protein